MKKSTKRMFKKIMQLNNKRMNEFVKIIAQENKKSKLYVKFDMLMNFLKRGTGYTDYYRGNYINLTKEDFISFLNKFNVVFAKDPLGECGHGIKKIVVNEIEDKDKLYKELINNKQYLVEEAIIQSDELNEINPKVVNSFRVVTLIKDGKPYVIANALRVNQFDNEVIGCTNDMYFSLNEEGKIDSNVLDDYGNVYKKHPLTSKEFDEVIIPDVKKAFEMCKKAALEIPEVRYVGWDVAFTNNGPVIVEGNEYPGYGILQFYKLKDKRTGHLKDIEDIIGDELKKIK